MIRVTVEGVTELQQNFKSASAGAFKDHLSNEVDAMAFEFLELVQDEIISSGTVDTRRLLSSFNKGNDNNIFGISNGGLTFEVGTNVDYASFVNDGHFTNPEGVDVRWVPGSWSGSTFNYEPGNRRTGMLLRQQWVEGTSYWDNAVRIFERMFQKTFEQSNQDWLDKHFG